MGVNTTTDSASLPAEASNPAYQAYQLLHVAFVVAPIVAGVDKFFDVLVNWDQYLAPFVAGWFGAHPFMMAVGVIEIIAGIGVALKPRIFAYVVALWLAGIIVNLLINPAAYSHVYGWGLDIALRDFGLLLGALAFGRLSQQFSRA